ncbi:MAG: response regulator [Myxococcales bacterium]|nr:MAG: response regulator [Myxococcales bacterium]
MLNLDRRRVLIAETDENLLNLYAQEFVRAGCEVASTNDGREAIHLAQTWEPDLVITEVRMPRAEEFAVLAAVRDECKRTPVILNSSFCHYLQDFRSWSADAFLIKTSDMEELKWTAVRLLGGTKNVESRGAAAFRFFDVEPHAKMLGL